LTTYITAEGSFTCNYYYEAGHGTNFFYGNMENIISENETGNYNGKKIDLKLEGKNDGTRILHVSY
tara:strand:+ start:203 stop:400 length:198 start_codon:yes stop_codon:yes gene_type:complete